MLYKRILLAYDGSDAGQKALLDIRELAQWNQSELVLVAVIVLASAIAGVAAPYLFSRLIDGLQAGTWGETIIWGFAAYAVLFGLSYMELPLVERPAIGAYAGVKMLLYVTGWASFPLVMIPVAKLLRLSDAYVPMIIACNWASVVRMAVWLPLAALFAAGIVDGDLASATALAVYVTLQVYMYLVIRTSAKCDAMTAAGIVALDAVLSRLLEQGVGQLL